MTKYAYLIGVTMFFIIWATLFLYKKQYRKEMLIMSTLSAPLGAIYAKISQDYWMPTYAFPTFSLGLENILFSFAIGGIAATIYETLFLKKSIKTKAEPILMPSILLIGLVTSFTLILILKINSIYAGTISMLAISILILAKRKDLIKNAILSGILITLIMFIFYLIYIAIFPTIIQDWWILENISGILIFKIPIEELMWGFAWGFLLGPLYEFWKGKKEIPNK